MKYSQLSPAPKLTVRRATAVAMFEHEGLVARMEKAEWIKPFPSGGVTLYFVDELEAATKRLKTEKLPL